MEYELSTQEFYSLQACARQIDLVADLCAVSVSNRHEISVDGLQSFLDAQKKALSTVLQTVEDRYENQFEKQAVTAPEVQPLKGVTSELLARVIDVCSGAAIEEAAVASLHVELLESLQDDITPLSAFYAALQRQGYLVNFSVHGGTSHFTIKKPGSPEKTTAAKKPRPAPRKRERLAATVA